MGDLTISKGNDQDLIVQGSKNEKSKEKQIVKMIKPKSDNEDESSKLTDGGSMKKFKKKWITSNCYYCRKVFHH